MQADQATTSFLDNFLLGGNPAEIFANVVLLLVTSAMLGKILRRPWLEGQALGLLILVGAAGTAFYLSRGLQLTLALFPFITLLFAAGIVGALRLTAFRLPHAGRPAGQAVWYGFAFLALVAWSVRVLTPDPAAGYSAFQAWNPLYLDASFRAGFFLLEQDMMQEPGFLTHDAASYAIDGLGLAALVHDLTGISTHAAQSGYSIAALIATLGLLLFGLRRNLFAVSAFVLMFLVFYRYSDSLGVVTKNDWTDTSLYLGGTTAMYYMVTGEAGRVARFGSAFAASVSVLARSYAAVYAALIAAYSMLADLLQKRLRATFAGWVIVGAVMTALTLREILAMLFGDVFHARPNMLVLHPPSFTKSLQGTLHDWGILPDHSHFDFPVPILLPALVMLAVLVYRQRGWRGRRVRALAIVLSPFLLLIGPLLVEALTGYRKGVHFSKIYIFAIFLFSWYPCWLMSRLPRGAMAARLEGLLDRIIRFGAPALVAASLAIAAVKHESLGRWLANAQETYRSGNHDLMIARALKDRFSETEMACIAAKPIVYYYYEPGLGLRYYVGGRFEQDYDFWNDALQERLARSEPLETILKDMGYPAFYRPNPVQNYGEWMATDAYRNYLGEIADMGSQPYVTHEVCALDACLFLTGPRGASSPCDRAD
jgi:hypothetical protein